MLDLADHYDEFVIVDAGGRDNKRPCLMIFCFRSDLTEISEREINPGSVCHNMKLQGRDYSCKKTTLFTHITGESFPVQGIDSPFCL